MLVALIRKLEGTVRGFVDPERPKGSSYLGAPVLGSDDVLEELYREGVERAVVGVGMNCATTHRQVLSETCRNVGFGIPRLLHPTSFSAADAQLGPEVQLMPRAVVNTGARLGRGTLVNTTAVVEHDCVVGKYSHVATGAHLGGEVEVGTSSCIGLGASILPGVTIGSEVSVGAGAVVVEDVDDGATVVGNPARSAH